MNKNTKVSHKKTENTQNKKSAPSNNVGKTVAVSYALLYFAKIALLSNKGCPFFNSCPILYYHIPSFVMQKRCRTL